MTKRINKLLILSSGGDAPGMNSAIRAAARTALHHRIPVIAAEKGYQGLIEKNIFEMDKNSVANIIMRGGTILKTGRSPEFYEKSYRDQCRQFLQEQGIDAMIVLGGDGSFAGARLLSDEGGPAVIGIPCTIDNDIVGSEYCIGFDTACNTALEAIDRIRDTAFSLERNFIIEVMGRRSGFIAVDVGMSGGAEIILTPEFPLSAEQIVTMIHQQRGNKLGSLIVAAESGKPNSTIQLAEAIKKLSGIEYKVCILGYIQRGGTPSVKDRKIASLMGTKAVEALLEGHSSKMTAIQHDQLVLENFPDAKCTTRFFQDEALLRINDILCS